MSITTRPKEVSYQVYEPILKENYTAYFYTTTKWEFHGKSYSRWVQASCDYCKVTGKMDGLIFKHCGIAEPAPPEIVELFNAWKPDYKAPVFTRNADKPLTL